MEGPSSDRWDVLVYERVYRTLYAYGLPTICLVGFVGNVMNLLILTGRRIQHSLRTRERSANACLIALAVADMAFCISAFPSTFLPQNMTFDQRSFLAYYACYCAAVINIFIMTSTWLTVVMSTERYLAICHPLKSRNFISLRKTKSVIAIVCFASVVFNVPVFWRYSISSAKDDNDTGVSYRVMHTGADELFDHTYRGLWAVLGNFIPLLFLVLCNASLARKIHRSYDLRQRMNAGRTLTTEPTARRRRRWRRQSSSHSSTDQDSSSSRITVTLVSIVVMFFLLVAPSEIVKLIAYLVGGDLSHNYTYMTIEVVTNVMQTVNFSANFVLYCIVNPPFRKVMREMTSCVWRRKRRRRSTGGQCTHGQLLLQSQTSERSPYFRHQIIMVRDSWYRDAVTSTAYYGSSLGAVGPVGGNSRKKSASVVLQ